MDDIAALLQGLQDPTAEEKQAALARALSRQRAVGNLGLLTGDRVLAGFGQAQVAQAGQGEAGLSDNRRQTLQMALAAQARDAGMRQQAAELEAQGKEKEASRAFMVGENEKDRANARLVQSLKRRGGGGAAPGRDLPATTVLELADVPTAIQQVSSLSDSFKKYGMDSTSAKLSNMLPNALGSAFGTDVSKFQSDALLAMQGVGKIMEGGKLAAGDEAKYRSMLPKPGESAATAENKVKQAQDFLGGLVANRIKALRAAGFKTPEMADLMPQAPGVTPSSPSSAPALRGPASGVVKMRFPDGSVHDVPEDKVESARRKGGSEVR